LKYRTDLAIENKEMYDSENKGEGIEISGVEVENEKFEEVVGITRIKITDEHGSKVLQKPLGNYITLEVDGVVDGPEEIKEKAAIALSNELKRLIQFHNKLKVLIIGLGNDKVTPDSLGPYTVSQIKVTRHYFLTQDMAYDQEMSCVSGFIPGVMGSPGMEIADLILAAAIAVVPQFAFAVGSEDSAPPTPTETTTDCAKGEIWDEKTGACIKAEDSSLNDDQRFGEARDLAYAGPPDGTVATPPWGPLRRPPGPRPRTRARLAPQAGGRRHPGRQAARSVWRSRDH